MEIENGLINIRNIGQKAAIQLAEKFKSIDMLKNAEICDIMEIDGFGEIMAESVYNYFKEPSSVVACCWTIFPVPFQ